MPLFDGCDKTFGDSNKLVVDNSYHDVSLESCTNANKRSSLPPKNLMVQHHPPSKYGVDHFPSLSDLNDELKGRFEKILPSKITFG